MTYQLAAACLALLALAACFVNLAAPLILAAAPELLAANRSLIVRACSGALPDRQIAPLCPKTRYAAATRLYVPSRVIPLPPIRSGAVGRSSASVFIERMFDSASAAYRTSF